MSSNGFSVNCSNINELTPDQRVVFNSKEYWHKFLLENAGLYDKEVILLAVLDSVAPVDLVPVKYTVEGKDAYFLARNCGEAIEKFCVNSLAPIKLKEPLGEVIISIETCSIPINDYKVNMQYHLKQAIEKRYDTSHKGFINLSSFHKEPDLFEVFFCPLSQPRFLKYVLSILKRILSITSINLSNNNIQNLTPLEILREFDGFISLDLSNNKIKDLSVAEFLGKVVPKLEELNLNDNPICSIFQNEAEYIQWITGCLPSLKIMDGVSIKSSKMSSKQVCTCSEKPLGIVNEFLKHYFTIYDDSRKLLENTYEKHAIFSMTCDPCSPSKDSRLECYQQLSKNFMKVNDENKIVGVSHLKNTEIAALLWKLPLTEHDPFSFKIDVLFYQEPFIVLTVSGVFKDYQEATRLRSFIRTFALKRVSTLEFKITNDLYHVKNATPEEINSSFTLEKPKLEKILLKFIVTKDEEQNLINVFTRLTEMNSVYSKRCLEECEWNIKKALEVFLENYQAHRIPVEAFTENSSN